ncbi:MAG: chromate transporter [Oscillospiraceae bacterium]|nr:chromate transporter [Oscillospiraceae bacterium]
MWELFSVFGKIGAFTFGAGIAMIPLIEEETVHKKHWITETELLDMIAISESTPGPISVNTATFVGCRVAGFGGAAAATVGLALPPTLIIIIVSYFLAAFSSNPWLNAAFSGIRAGVVLLTLNAVKRLSKNCPRNMFGAVMLAAAFLLATFTDVEFVLLIVAAVIAGIVYNAFAANGGEGDKG